jgi:hypothetical protein
VGRAGLRMRRFGYFTSRRLEREDRRVRRAGAVPPAVIAVVVVMGLPLWSWAVKPEAQAGRATVKRDGVRVHTQMTPTSDVAATLTRGTVVTVDLALSGPEGAWCQVTVAHRTGYVRCDDLEREPGPEWRETARRSFAAPGASTASLGEPTTVPISMIGDLILVSTTVNHKQKAVMIVDTGATVTVITPALLESLGRSVPAGAPRRQARVIGGAILEMPVVSLDSLQVGNATVEDFPVSVHEIFREMAGVDGLLGGDFLHRFRVILDKAAREMRLETLRRN